MNEERDLNAPASYGEVKEGLLGGAGMIFGAAYDAVIPDPMKHAVGATASFVGGMVEDVKASAKPGYTGPTDPGKYIVGATLNTMENFVQGASNIGGHTVQALGGDPEIGSDIGAVAGGLVLDKGLGKALTAFNDLPPPSVYSPVPVGVTAFDPPPVPNPTKGYVNQYTGTNPDYVPKGRTLDDMEGISKEAPYAGQLAERAAIREPLLKELARRKELAGGTTAFNKKIIKEKLPGWELHAARKDYKNFRDKVRLELSTGITDDVTDPIAYGTSRKTSAIGHPAPDKIQAQIKENMMGKDIGEVPGNIEFHHMFSKNETNEIVRRMEEVGDADDMVGLFKWTEDFGTPMGNRLKNMLATSKTPHSVTHHQIPIEYASQKGRKALRERLKNAKNADEVMEIAEELSVESLRSRKRFFKAQEIWDEIMQGNKKPWANMSEAEKQALKAQVKADPRFQKLIEEGQVPSEGP